MIHSIKLSNVACYVDEKVEDFTGINVFCGKNNTGKSTILKSICTVNGDNLGLYARALIGHGEIEVDITHKGLEAIGVPGGRGIVKSLLDSDYGFQLQIIRANDKNSQGYVSMGNVEPNCFLYHSFTKRRVGGISTVVDINRSRQSMASPDNISSKIDRVLSDREYPNHDQFRDCVVKILGFPLSSIMHDAGKIPGITIDEISSISIERMGDGVVQILFLLVELFNSKDKIFVLEEIENDLHPSSIIALCDLISKAEMRGNQFFISTHSNIVIRELAKCNSTSMYKIISELSGKIPSSQIIKADSLDAKIQLIEELGYDCYDIGMYKLWVVFEESSAQTFFRDYAFK